MGKFFKEKSYKQIGELKVRNKNAILELLQDNINFIKICIVPDLDQDEQTKQILALAEKKKIRIEVTPLHKMAKRRSGVTHEVIVAYINPKNHVTLKELLSTLEAKDEQPFFLLINRVDFDTNIGMIARTAYASGINGLIYQGESDRFLNDDSIHYSVGAIARLPLVKVNIFEALKVLKNEGIKTYCLDMEGENYSNADLKGPIALVLGEERHGISKEVAQRCTGTLSIPMVKPIDSLNVAISTAVVIYEKIRQEGI